MIFLDHYEVSKKCSISHYSHHHNTKIPFVMLIRHPSSQHLHTSHWYISPVVMAHEIYTEAKRVK